MYVCGDAECKTVKKEGAKIYQILVSLQKFRVPFSLLLNGRTRKRLFKIGVYFFIAFSVPYAARASPVLGNERLNYS